MNKNLINKNYYNKLKYQQSLLYHQSLILKNEFLKNEFDEPIVIDLIINSSNINIKTNKFKFEKTININKEMNYPFIINIENKNYIYYRNDTKDSILKPDHETTKRLILEDFDSIKDDTNYELKLGIANHNFRLFNINNKLYGIGGQACLKINYYEIKNTTNKTYLNYHKDDNIFICECSEHIRDICMYLP
jgi:hypothetical protein